LFKYNHETKFSLIASYVNDQAKYMYISTVYPASFVSLMVSCGSNIGVTVLYRKLSWMYACSRGSLGLCKSI